MLKHTVILLTIILASCDQAPPLKIPDYVGVTPNPYFEIWSHQFQKILFYVWALHSDVDGWEPTQVTQQPLENNDTLWDLILNSPNNSTQARAVVYHSTDNMARIELFEFLSHADPLPFPVDSWVIDQHAMGPDFVPSEEDTAWDFPECPKRNILEPPTQIPQTTSHNFTYFDKEEEKTIVVRTPIVPSELASTITLGEYTRLIGGDIMTPETLLFSLRPQLLSEYTLLEAYRRVDNQGYLMVVASTGDRYDHDQLVFTICFTDSGIATVSLVQSIRLSHYPVEYIGISVYASYQLYPQLDGYVLASVRNIWPDAGLKMLFGKQDGHILINYVYSHAGKIYSRLFSQPL